MDGLILRVLYHVLVQWLRGGEVGLPHCERVRGGCRRQRGTDVEIFILSSFFVGVHDFAKCRSPGSFMNIMYSAGTLSVGPNRAKTIQRHTTHTHKKKAGVVSRNYGVGN